MSHTPDEHADAVLPLRVGKWVISYDPPPIPFRGIDYQGLHDDFDGAPDANDRRCLRGSSVEDVLEQIKEMEDENA